MSGVICDESMPPLYTKLIILGREMGLRCDLKDVACRPVVPGMGTGRSREELLEALEGAEEAFRGQVLKYYPLAIISFPCCPRYLASLSL
jgi:hypothetical protein